MKTAATLSQTKYVVLASILIVFILITATFSYARAHSWPSYCAHSDHYFNGWYTDYVGHYTYGGQHWHQYDHKFLEPGTLKWINHHTEVNSCPN